jgi:hypothetical protein
MLMGFSNWPAVTDFLDSDFHGGHHHEYTPEEFRLAFESSGFAVNELTLYEETLRSSKLASTSDLQSRGRSLDKIDPEPLFVRIAKKALRAVTAAAPRLRSSMLLIACR